MHEGIGVHMDLCEGQIRELVRKIRQGVANNRIILV